MSAHPSSDDDNDKSLSTDGISTPEPGIGSPSIGQVTAKLQTEGLTTAPPEFDQDPGLGLVRMSELRVWCFDCGCEKHQSHKVPKDKRNDPMYIQRVCPQCGHESCVFADHPVKAPRAKRNG